MIHRLPPIIEVGSLIDEAERRRLEKGTDGVRAWLQGSGRPALSRSAAFLQVGERALAGSPQGVRPLEQRLAGLLRHAGSDQPVTAPDPEARFHGRARALSAAGTKVGKAVKLSAAHAAASRPRSTQNRMAAET